MYWTETKVRVRYSDVDRMNVVHNSKYFLYQEDGITDFLEKNNLNAFQDEKGYFTPVIENHMIYIKPAKYGEILNVKTTLYEITNTKMIYIVGIFNEQNEMLAYGQNIRCVSTHDMRPLAIKKENEEEHEKYKNLQCKDVIEFLKKEKIEEFFKNLEYKI